MKRINPVLLTLILPLIVNADTWDKKTTVNFSQPVEVPGYVLQPGKYVMKLVSLPADRHIVQFTNERENRVYATAAAVPAYRNEVTGKTVISFYEVPAGQPEAIRNWYYPGDNFGQEFVYPAGRLLPAAAVVTREFDSSREAVDSAPPPPSADSDTQAQADAAIASDAALVSQTAPLEVAQATPPAPPQAQPVPADPATPAPGSLPETASELPEIALFGFVFVGGALTARGLRRS